MPTLPHRPPSGPSGAELLDGGAFEEEVTTTEPVSHDGGLGTKIAAIATVSAIVLTFALISSPGAGTASDEGTATTSVAAGPTTAATAAAGTEPPPTTRPKQPIPLFEGNLPPELPGVIGGIDVLGAVVVIDQTLPGPFETNLGLTPAAESPHMLIGLEGMAPIGLEATIRMDGGRLKVEDADGAVISDYDVARLLPDGAGTVVVVELMGNTQVATLTSLAAGGGSGEPVVWEIDGQGPEILGAWDGRLVVHRANRTWLLDEGGRTELVAEGEVLTYDGLHLVRLDCPELGRCELAAGDPSAPDTYRVAVPEWIAVLSDEAWTGSVAVSPDGTRLGASVSYGGLSLPAVIDLETGEAESLADGMNNGAPVAWSPDSDWLAYAYAGDVMVWNVTGSRSWRIAVNRDLHALLWRGASLGGG
jgi:hypothetical protein